MQSAQCDAVQRAAWSGLTRAFGVVWLANAVFQAVAWLTTTNAQSNFIHALAKPASQVPAWIRPLLLAGLHVAQAVGPSLIAGIMVLVAVLLGLALLSQKKLALAARAGILYSAICWVFFNGFGFPYSGGQTDPGVFVAYAIAFMFVLAVAPALDSGDATTYRIEAGMWDKARIAFGLLWLFDAALKWLPAFLLHFSSQITSVIPGQPHWIAIWLGFIAEIVHGVGPITVAVLVGLSETAIAIALLSGRWLRLMVPFALVYSLSVWTTAEAFGGPYSSAGTGVRGNVLGNVLIYLIPLLFLWIGSSQARTARD